MNFTFEKLNEIENLASIFCSLEEIAIFFKVTIEELKKSEEAMKAYERGFVVGKIRLRRDQLQLADKTPAMATWLGKQYLDQKDKQEIDSNIGITVLELPKRERKKIRKDKK